MSKRSRRELLKLSMILTTKVVLQRILSWSSKSMQPRRTLRSGKERLRDYREIMIRSKRNLIRQPRKLFSRYSSQMSERSKLENNPKLR